VDGVDGTFLRLVDWSWSAPEATAPREAILLDRKRQEEPVVNLIV
jgi:hypothetical protein